MTQKGGGGRPGAALSFIDIKIRTTNSYISISFNLAL